MTWSGCVAAATARRSNARAERSNLSPAFGGRRRRAVVASRSMIQADADLEAYLTRLERPFERLSHGTYVIGAGARRPLVALKLAPPVLVVRAVIGDAPGD